MTDWYNGKVSSLENYIDSVGINREKETIKRLRKRLRLIQDAFF